MKVVLNLLEGGITAALVVFTCTVTASMGGSAITLMVVAVATGALSRLTFSKSTRS
jgi:hypothetical protein